MRSSSIQQSPVFLHDKHASHGLISLSDNLTSSVSAPSFSIVFKVSATIYSVFPPSLGLPTIPNILIIFRSHRFFFYICVRMFLFPFRSSTILLGNGLALHFFLFMQTDILHPVTRIFLLDACCTLKSNLIVFSLISETLVRRITSSSNLIGHEIARISLQQLKIFSVGYLLY